MPQMRSPFITPQEMGQDFKNIKDPMTWMKYSPMMVMDRMTPHGMLGLGPSGKMGKKGGQGGYATGELDLASAQARQDITDFLRSSEEQQKKDYADQVQRGIENRKVAKEQENKAIYGPKLDATKMDKMPGFLSKFAPEYVSGADRGTLYGAALEKAMKEGKTSVPEMKQEIGAKGSRTGLRDEAIPEFKAQQRFDPLTPEYLLHANAQMQANQMNQPKKGMMGK